jgi:uncharacterized alpha-E superfamily protein
MLSRVGDSLYWMSRYLERAEHSARLIGIQLNLMLDESAGSSPTLTGLRRWSRVLESLTLKASPEGDVSTDVQVRGFDLISDCILSARENARQVREQISSEMWEQLNRLFHEVNRMGTSDIWDTHTLDFLTAVIEGSHLFQGVTDSTMSHGEGWHFIQLGRSLERATATAQLLDVHFQAFKDDEDQAMDSGAHLEWTGLLRTCTAFEAYCKVYTADLKPERVAEFLLLNSDFPHSIRFSADQMQQSLECIHDITASKKATKVSKLAGRLRAELTFTPLEEIMANPSQFFETIRSQCAQIHSGVHQVYVSYPIDVVLEA